MHAGCPKELQVVGGGSEGSVIGCKSACEAFGLDQYCCSGQFANPATCQPSNYSTIFKRACPRAYSYAFDDGKSTFTCKAFDYAIFFCPNGNGYIFSPHHHLSRKFNCLFSFQLSAFTRKKHPWCRTRNSDDALAPPRYEVLGSRNVVRTVYSSSNRLLPVPLLILLLIVYILSWSFCEAGSVEATL